MNLTRRKSLAFRRSGSDNRPLICDGYTTLVPQPFADLRDRRAAHFLSTTCGKDQFDCGASGRTPPAIRWISA
jgi:hypothetical protein